MDSGVFVTHLRRMRRVYAGRQQVLFAALAHYLTEHLIAEPDPSGMYFVCRPGLVLVMCDIEIAARSAKAGLTARALSAYWPGGSGPQGLVLGYAAFFED